MIEKKPKNIKTEKKNVDADADDNVEEEDTNSSECNFMFNR